MSGPSESYCASLHRHYETSWNRSARIRRCERGPTWNLPPRFHVLEFSPSELHRWWIYATCGMSLETFAERLELYLLSPCEAAAHVEFLSAVSHFHTTGERLGLGHTINIGRPWLPQSRCDRGLISLPYLDGPGLETHETTQGMVRVLWLIPITREEVAFKIANGLEALEQLFDSGPLDYMNPDRPSMV